jgi:MFS family permease
MRKCGFKNSYFRGNLLVLAVSGVVSNLGAGIIGLFMPEYFKRLGGNTLILGLMGFLVFVVQLFTVLLGGFIADNYGRRKVIVLTAFYGALFPLLYAVFQEWRLFIVLNVIAAFGSVSAPASHAIVVDSIPPEKRATGISALQVFSSLPLIIVPLLWGWMIDNLGWIEGFKRVSIYSVATALASAFILLFFLRETIKPQTTAKLSSQSLKPWTSFSEIKRSLSTSLKALMIAYFLIAFANSTVGYYYIIYATEVIKLNAFEWGMILSLQILSAIILKILGAWVADKFGKKKVLIISASACAPFTILFTLSHSFVQVLIIMLLLVVAGIYYGPVNEALQADLTPRSMRGRIITLWIIGNAFAGAIGVFVGGLLFHTVSPQTPFYLFTAAELVAVVFLVAGVREPLKKEV